MTSAFTATSEKEFRIIQKAGHLCSPLNGSRWLEARELLERAEFEVFFE